jgi:hypothetical protein
MLIVDFLLHRCHEVLDDASCDYEIDRAGHLNCRCEDPAANVLEALDTMALVLWLAELDGTGETFLRMLADAHADHPEYRPEWHQLSKS